MNLSSITEEYVAKISNRDIINLHYRLHQVYHLNKNKNYNKNESLINKTHSVIVAEMASRKIRHNTNLESALEALFN